MECTGRSGALAARSGSGCVPGRQRVRTRQRDVGVWNLCHQRYAGNELGRASPVPRRSCVVSTALLPSRDSNGARSTRAARWGTFGDGYEQRPWQGHFRNYEQRNGFAFLRKGTSAGTPTTSGMQSGKARVSRSRFGRHRDRCQASARSRIGEIISGTTSIMLVGCGTDVVVTMFAAPARRSAYSAVSENNACTPTQTGARKPAPTRHLTVSSIVCAEDTTSSTTTGVCCR